MTVAQRNTVEKFLAAWQVRAVVHGDSLGSDAEFDAIARGARLPRVLRPASDGSSAHSEREGGKILQRYQAKPAFSRNMKIVEDCDVLLVAPGGPETDKSLTWLAIRFARRAATPVVVVAPSGQIEIESVRRET